MTIEEVKQRLLEAFGNDCYIGLNQEVFHPGPSKAARTH